MKAERKVTGILAVIGAEIIFGCSFLFTKSVTGQVSVFTLISWRFLLAFAVMSLLRAAGVIQVRYRGKDPRLLFAIGLLQPVLYFTCETFGIGLTTASESGTIIAAIPVVTLICASFILKERPGILQMTGIGITLAGVLLIVLTQGTRPTFNAAGYLMLFIAVLSYSLYSVFVQKARRFTGMELTYAMVGLGAAVFCTAAAVEHGIKGTLPQLLALPFTNRPFLIAILYLGILSSIGAFFLSNVAIRILGTNRTATFVGLTTATAVILGVLVLRETFTGWQAAGVILILAGVYTANAPASAGKRQEAGGREQLPEGRRQSLPREKAPEGGGIPRSRETGIFPAEKEEP